MSNSTTINLLPHQTPHVENVSKILDAYRVAIDTSPTGAGKTFTSLYQSQNYKLPLFVVAPKSISLVWKKITSELGIDVHSINSYDLISSRMITVKEPVLLIVDEFHFIKNQTKRYRVVLRLLKNLSKESKVIFLSATPYDKKEHTTQMRSLIRAVSPKAKFDDCLCSMKFKLSVPISITNGYYNFSEDDMKIYSKGVEYLELLAQWQNSKVPPPPGLIAKLIGAGTRDTHYGTMETVIRLAKIVLNENPTSKVVIIGKFLNQLDYISDELEEYGVVQLDGRTTNRLEILEKFQSPDIDTRVIVTSAQVGGVGINLDDQNGGFPRTMFIIPSYECIDMIQCIGRIYRTNTKSAANVVVIYNNKIRCPIESSLLEKSKIIGKLSENSLIPLMENFYEYREEKSEESPKIMLNVDSGKKINKTKKDYLEDKMPKKYQKQIQTAKNGMMEVLSELNKQFIK